MPPPADLPRGASLARRVRRTLEHQAELERLAQQVEARRRRMLEQERAALLEELAAFGAACGPLEVSRPDGGVQWAWRGRTLRFAPEPGSARVLVSGPALTGDHHLLLHEVLGRWVWSYRPRTGAEQQRPLFDAGLEELLGRGLDLRPLSDAELGALPHAPRTPEP